MPHSDLVIIVANGIGYTVLAATGGLMAAVSRRDWVRRIGVWVALWSVFGIVMFSVLTLTAY